MNNTSKMFLVTLTDVYDYESFAEATDAQAEFSSQGIGSVRLSSTWNKIADELPRLRATLVK